MTTQTTFLPLAHALADAAGDILRRHFRTPLKASRKADQSPVTKADLEAESAMRALLAAHPDHGFYGEEHERTNPKARLQWVIDPIDGTRAFMAGIPTFTTLIALVENNRPILGIIDQPILRERWVGVRGEATTLNGAPIRTSSCKDLATARLATTSTDYFTPAQSSAFSALGRLTSTTLHGGDAYLYAMLASGHLDLVLDAQLKPYDFCAVIPVVEGAGGIIREWTGKDLTLTSNGNVIAVSNKNLYAPLKSIMELNNND